MGARALDDQPLGALDALFIGLWVFQIAEGDGARGGDFRIGSAPKDDALARDWHRQAFAGGHRAQVDIRTTVRMSPDDARRDGSCGKRRAKQGADTSRGGAAEAAARDRLGTAPIRIVGPIVGPIAGPIAGPLGAHARRPPGHMSFIAGRERRPPAYAPAARRRWECA